MDRFIEGIAYANATHKYVKSVPEFLLVKHQADF